MSRITLYKNCFLQKDYKEVLHPTVLDSYLNTLEKTTITNVEDRIFMRLSDRINFNINKIGYNYMKVENSNMTFYNFIDDIVVHNETIDVLYSLDVWNTFFNKCQIRNGILNRSLWCNKNNERYLPLEYEGNNALEPQIYVRQFSTLNQGDKFNHLLITVQYYKLSSAGEISERKIGSFIQARITEDDIDLNIYIKSLGKLDELLAYQSQQVFNYNDDSYYYDIIDIHVIPESWGYKINQTLRSSLTYSKTKQVSLQLTDTFTGIMISDINLFTDSIPEIGGIKEYSLFSDTISFSNINDYKNKFIGPLDKLSEVKLNGLETNYEYFMVYSGTLFHFFLKFNNQIIEVSDSLRLNIPYTSITGETSALRELSAEMSYQQGKAQQISGIYNLATGVLGGVIGASLGNPMALASPINSLAGNVSDIALGNTKTEQAFAEKYSTSSPSADLKSNAFYTAQFINKPVKISTNNDTEVESALIEQGFKVRYLIQGLPTNDATVNNIYTNDFNVVKYGSLTVIGEAPHFYIENIKRILESGTRIWYTIPYAI